MSSVAMLLVATVAVGSATFAWFSTKTTATAKGVKVQTTQASSLVLSLDQTNWASEIDLGIYTKEGETVKPKTLEPASTADLTNWFTATSTGYDLGTVDKTTIGTAAEGTNYVAKTFYAKSIGADLDVDWSMLFDTAQVATDKNYMRAAMTISGDGISGQKQVFWWADGSSESKVGETTRNNKTDAISSSAGATSDVTSSTATTGQLATLTGDEVYTVNLYVWFEGQDLQCIDTKAGTVCDFNLQFAKRA
ncbi:MAG: hypothetical protein ACI4G1_05550 [Ruminococcus sp.]